MWYRFLIKRCEGVRCEPTLPTRSRIKRICWRFHKHCVLGTRSTTPELYSLLKVSFRNELYKIIICLIFFRKKKTKLDYSSIDEFDRITFCEKKIDRNNFPLWPKLQSQFISSATHSECTSIDERNGRKCTKHPPSYSMTPRRWTNRSIKKGSRKQNIKLHSIDPRCCHIEHLRDTLTRSSHFSVLWTRPVRQIYIYLFSRGR